MNHAKRNPGIPKRRNPQKNAKVVLGVQSRELVDWIEFESSGFDCPSFADELVGCEAFEDLQSPSEIVGADEVGEMPAELIIAVVVVAFDGPVLDGSVHPFDLTVGPGMVDLGEAVLDVVLAAAHGEHVRHICEPSGRRRSAAHNGTGCRCRSGSW